MPILFEEPLTDKDIQEWASPVLRNIVSDIKDSKIMIDADFRVLSTRVLDEDSEEGLVKKATSRSKRSR